MLTQLATSLSLLHAHYKSGLFDSKSLKVVNVARKLSFFSGQWADVPLADLAQKAQSWGYDGIELANFGDHFNARRALDDDSYVQEWQRTLSDHGLEAVAISAHPLGQAITDFIIDDRHRAVLPAQVWGDGKPEGVRQRAAASMIELAHAAARVGVPTVVGFSGSPHWHGIAGFPPVSAADVDAGFREFADRWNPIIDAFEAADVRFALEVHPGQVAFDYWSTKQTLDALNWRPGFGINFDPGHLYWQFIDLHGFLQDYAERIYHVHVKEATRHLNGRNGILSGLMDFGDLHRGWDFASVGHGDLNWEAIIRTLNGIGYEGPLSVEWDDAHISREVALRDAVPYLRAASVERSGGDFQQVFGLEA